MKALIICGSRDGGFTAEMCRSFSKGLAVHGILSEVLFPIEMNIGHCAGCGDCSVEGVCNISDDMDIFYEAFKKCDLLVMATPMHFSGPSSVIKTIIDRFQPLWFKNKKHPEYATALLSGGGPVPNFNNTVSIFKTFSITAGVDWLGYLGIPHTDEIKVEDVSEPSFNYGKEIGLILIRNQI
jgi:multimeric flavodoxin WrbA